MCTCMSLLCSLPSPFPKSRGHSPQNWMELAAVGMSASPTPDIAPSVSEVLINVCEMTQNPELVEAGV